MRKHGEAIIPRDRWHFYRILEGRLIEFDKIIPVDSGQLKTVKSPELAEIIIHACVHFDSLIKKIALETGLITQVLKNQRVYYKIVATGKEKMLNIDDWRNLFPDISNSTQIQVKRLLYAGDKPMRKPFLGWKYQKSPPKFWSIYNNLKHDMYNNWKDSKKGATYEIAVQAVSALLALNFEAEMRWNPSLSLQDFYLTANKVNKSFDDFQRIRKHDFIQYSVVELLEKCIIETDFYRYEIDRDKLWFDKLKDFKS